MRGGSQGSSRQRERGRGSNRTECVRQSAARQTSPIAHRCSCARIAAILWFLTLQQPDSKKQKLEETPAADTHKVRGSESKAELSRSERTANLID